MAPSSSSWSSVPNKAGTTTRCRTCHLIVTEAQPDRGRQLQMIRALDKTRPYARHADQAKSPRFVHQSAGCSIGAFASPLASDFAAVPRGAVIARLLLVLGRV